MELVQRYVSYASSTFNEQKQQVLLRHTIYSLLFRIRGQYDVHQIKKKKKETLRPDLP
jgi:hypothetical protein